MALSTSPASPSPDPAALGVEALAGFYRWHARIYDLTRPFLLFGRARAVRALDVGRGHLVLDVGCGTGHNFEALARREARLIGIECSPDMRRRAQARALRVSADSPIAIDERPYGTHGDYQGAIDRILFSYSLSMMPPYAELLARARADLRSGGRIVVVDFLDARPPVARALEASHVFLGPSRLDALRRLFPEHRVEVRSVGLWRFFLFHGLSPFRHSGVDRMP
jgi:S-adenosylmethionine-diacylgycerolhomoserine-N-methlytransferase